MITSNLSGTGREVQSAPADINIRGIRGTQRATAGAVLNIMSLNTNLKTQVVTYILQELLSNQPFQPKNAPEKHSMRDSLGRSHDHGAIITRSRVT